MIGIVIVTWNGLHDTLKCLTSLRHQTYPQWQAVVVDNASQDGTPDCIADYFPEVCLIQNERNTGYVHANNQGIDYLMGQDCQWILLLNNDVVMQPDALAEMVRVGDENPQIGVIGPLMQRTLRPDVIDMGGDLDFRWGRVLLRRCTDETPIAKNWLPIDYVWGCTLMARREIMEKVGGLAPIYDAYFEDAELCLRAKKLGYMTAVALQSKVIHAVGSSGEKRFLWQTYLRTRNHALFFLRFSQPRDWSTLLPALFLWQLPEIVARSAALFLARTLRRKKYVTRPIKLWGYVPSERPPSIQIQAWLQEAGYFEGPS
ncbi:MAG: glycosyltransferase family 2 protein [Anaerolineae bacterium]|nr:glycosyltransferase family 2 protein [Anaerolineae bacterium]